MRVVRAVALGVVPTAVLVGCAAGPGPGPGNAQPPPVALDRVEAPFASCPEQGAGAVARGNALPPLGFDCVGGGRLDLRLAPGVPTVVNLWGSWCGPCREELPVLESFAEGAGDRVRVVGVISKDGVPQAASFAEDAGVTLPSAFDGEGELMAELGLNGLPYTAFLAADGTLVHSELGPVDSVAELRGLVAEHLGVQL